MTAASAAPTPPGNLLPGVLSATSSGLVLTAGPSIVAPKPGGYWPLRVELKPSVPIIADRSLMIEVRNGFGPWDRNNRVLRYVEMPAGSGTIIFDISVPVPDNREFWQVSLYEDGTLLPGMQLNSYMLSGNRQQQQEGSSIVLFVDDQAGGGVRQGLGWIKSLKQLKIFGDSAPSEFGTLWPTGAAHGPERLYAAPALTQDLPEKWIDYSGLDALTISLEQLEQLRSSRPAACQAILDWTAAGGNLWISGAGREWQNLPRVERLLSLRPLGEGQGVRAGWLEPEADDRDGDRATRESEALTGSRRERTLRQPAKRKPAESSPFLLRPLGTGMIVAIAAGEPLAEAALLGPICDALGHDRLIWSQRHGLSSPEGQNPDYWNFLIPGAGVAPVTAFCVLITLFAVVIGPANYWILRRRKRLHLLVLTTPVIAAVAVALLMGYAIAKDGLGVRVRARSVTHLDQRRGHAACWSRLSYIAGLAPRGGLRFPADTALLPLEYSGREFRRETGPVRELIWEDREQHFTTGWLTARTPTQFVAVRSRASRAGLDFAASGGGNPTVANRLGTRVGQLLVRMESGRHYWCEGIEPDATAELEPVEAKEGMARLGRIYLAEKLETPADVPMPGSSFGVITFPIRGPRGIISQQTSRLEQELALLGRSAGPDDSPIASRSYIAVVDRSPEVSFGVSRLREESSFHVVIGSW